MEGDSLSLASYPREYFPLKVEYLQNDHVVHTVIVTSPGDFRVRTFKELELEPVMVEVRVTAATGIVGHHKVECPE